jgi:hypothetical protein
MDRQLHVVNEKASNVHELPSAQDRESSTNLQVLTQCPTARRRHKRTSAFLHLFSARFNQACQQGRPRTTTTSQPWTKRRNPQKRRKPAPNAQISKAEPRGRQPRQVGGVGFVPLSVVGFDEVEVSDDADFSAVADVESVVSRQGLKFVGLKFGE